MSRRSKQDLLFRKKRQRMIRTLAHSSKGQKEIQNALKEAEAANRAKSDFLANMSHEIRTPINAILGMNEMILRESKNETVMGYARNVEAAGMSLLSIINDILDFSKIESGRLDVVNAEYQLSSLLNDVNNLIRVKTDQKGIEFKMEVSPELPEIMYGDRLRVQQIMVNLLNNAVKYTDKGKVTFSIEPIRLMTDEADIKITVADTGRGIPENELEMIFDKFRRSDLGNNNTIEGSGLGLAITRTLVERMNGEISVKSVYGAGSIFTASIRQGFVSDEAIGDFEERLKTRQVNKPRYRQSFVAPEARILVVDDTPLNLEVVESLLKKTQMRIDTAPGGAECIELVSKNHYDVILLDARMPKMDGVETLNEMKKQRLIEKDTAVIVLTANAVSGARENYLDSGFDEYISKPIEPRKLEEMLLRYIPEEKVTLQENDEEEEDGIIPAWLKNVPEIDVEHGLANCGTAEIYMDTVVRFARSAGENILALQQFLSQRNLKDFTIKIHSVKSSSRLVGADRLSRIAQSLEDAGDRGDSRYISERVGQMFGMYGALASALAPLQGRTSPGAPGENHKKIEIDEEHVGQLFAHLKEYVEDFNDQAVESMVRSLDRFHFPGKEQERFDMLKQAMEEMDWAAMLAAFD
ncbi:MAG: response regulator [Lachnospiraceae bacterium]|nr:response regulator [Lachnospiraceae bacterium]